ncbi:MAG TPA: PilZ domain-containing protein, partial [Thermoanaerobaculia bacterium]
MTPSEIERRRAERVRLSRPLVGRLDASEVVVADVSIHGAGVQHRYGMADRDRAKLEFYWRDEEIAVDCRVVRSRMQHFTHGVASLTVFHTGLSFEPADASRIEKIVAAHAARAARR